MTGADWLALFFGTLAIVIVAAMLAAYFITPEFIVPVLIN